MKLSDILSGEKQINDLGTMKAGTVSESTVARQIKALVPGQILQGEVLAKSGQEVQIRLSDAMILNARLEQNMNFDIGKLMSFEVKNNGSSLLLSPLFTNLTTDANVLKALDMASLPINETTVDMTSKLMEAGLPIDKNSLQQVYREVNAYNDATVLDIVNLHKMNLPVNDKNVGQLVSYRNFSNQMVDGMQQIIQDMPQVFQGMLQEGNVEGAAKLYQQLLQLVQEAVSGEGTLGAEGVENAIPSTAPDVNAGAEAMQNTPLQSMTEGAGNALINDTSVMINTEAFSDVNVTNHADGTNGTDAAQSAQNADAALHGVENENTANQMAQTGEIPQGMPNGQQVQSNQEQTELPANWKDGKEFQKLLDTLQNQWSLKPEDVADKQKVEALYQRIDKHMKQLHQILESTGATESSSYKAINTMEQKLDFMQQMNQVYQFVQLPLKLHYGDAQGDLYVYTNKRNLLDKDGKISALLHLDMENLGPVDVYVAMQQEKVSTKFYVSDEVLDFLEAHMDILTARLQKRGYQYHCEMIVREEESQGINSVELLRQQEEEYIPLAQYAFDVRT